MSEETASSVEEQGTDGADELAAGTSLLQGQYTITAFLNAGGFGITYRAQDSLERPIVIKECFPGAFCRRSRTIVQARSRAHKTEFASIVRHFVEEARSLSKLDHPNIVGVHQVWEENDTAYMALDFVEGRDLLDIIEDKDLVSALQPAQIEAILRQVLDAIGFVHAQDMLHRDISPDNILVRPDLTPVLIDFGAARQQVNTENKVLSALRVVKDGYSPQEFYVTGSEQGPYSDLYALGASFYHVIAGEAPPDSQTRLSAIATGAGDPYKPLQGRIDGYAAGVLASIDASLKVLPAERLQSAADWLAMMDGTGNAQAKATVALDQIAANSPTEPRSSKAALMIGVAVVALIAAGVGGYATGMFGPSQMSDDLAAPVETSATTASVETDTTNAPIETRDTETASVAEALATSPAEEQAQPVAEADAEAFVADPALDEALASAEARPWAEDAQTDLANAIAELKVEPRAVTAPETSAQPQVRPVFNADIEPADDATEAPVNASLTEDGIEAFGPEATTSPAEIAAILLPETPSPLPDAASQAIEGRMIDLNSPDMALAATMPVAPAAPGALVNPPASAGRLAVLPAIPDTPDFAPGAQTAELAGFQPLFLPAGLNAGDVNLAPDTSQAITETPAGWPVAIAVQAPEFGAEIIPATAVTEPASQAPDTAFEGDFVQTDWSVALPFDDLRADEVGSIWIRSIEGLQVERREDLNRVLQEMYDLSGVDEISLNLGLGARNGEAILEHSLTLAVVQETRLPNGLVFEARAENGQWITRVTDVPSSLTTDLMEGDIIYAYVPTGERLDGRTTLPTLLRRELLAGQANFSFAVDRNGTRWLASMTP